MTQYPTHEQAARDALTLIGRLPVGTVWSFFMATNDDPATPGTFNIYSPRAEWRNLRDTFVSLGEPIDTDEDFETYRFRATIVSFIQETSND